ncbi:MAG: hypothetical protein MUF34_08160 [Polyangiaceae bacterium]|jgi:hypothetical protein|nr:hypothetical protein [Polyangiaceae bacterium]
MAEFALYRSMHNLRTGQAKPARQIALTAEEASALREAGLVRAQAWALDDLTMMLRDLGARLQFLRADAIEALCREAGASSLTDALRPALETRLQADARVRALRLALEAGREAENHQMTLRYTPDDDGA